MALDTSYFAIFLSDTACSNLTSLGRNLGYIRGQTRLRGFGPFLSALLEANPSSQDWSDTRPPTLQRYALIELEEGDFSSWDNGEQRMRHLIYFSPSDRDLTATLAREIGTIKRSDYTRIPKRHPFSRRIAQPALISQFWEAVGLTYLTPSITPKAPGTLYKTKHKEPFQELDW